MNSGFANLATRLENYNMVKTAYLAEIELVLSLAVVDFDELAELLDELGD